MTDLAALASEASRLAWGARNLPLADRRNPEAPHIAKSELAKDLDNLAKSIEALASGAPRSPASRRRDGRPGSPPPPRAVAKLGIRGVVAADGRIVPVVRR